MFTADDFQLDVEGVTLDVTVRNVKERVLFVITFSDHRPQLVLTRLTNRDGKKVWTSIPEGRMPEAQLIGPFIIDHFKNL